ncbi:MAG: hypothetical protein EBU40_16495 [Proteobacteria bacterium]|jgi:mannonate dehydratase|nr:hypothetical protein [Pseudomonadota bacterium]
MFPESGKVIVPFIEEIAITGRNFMVHFRNICVGYLDFEEVFPDEGNVDMQAAVLSYRTGAYAGLLCPDYVPLSDLERNPS